MLAGCDLSTYAAWVDQLLRTNRLNGVRRLLVRPAAVIFSFLVALLVVGVGPTAAQDVNINVPEVADAIESSGRYLELSDSSVTAAIDRANAENVAFVWLDQNGNGDVAARSIMTELGARQSSYGAVVVLTSTGVWSAGVEAAGPALDDATTGIFQSDVGQGLDTFVDRLSGSATSGAPSSGGGFPWIIPLLLAVVGFIGFRMWSGSRKTKRVELKTIEDDRAEIKEQLKNNADRVMTFGDRVIKSGDSELISMYEEASRTYQDVSQGVNDAKTATEVDLLDDRIDKAEWQFDVIEARLENRTPPPFPVDPDDGPVPPAPGGTRTGSRNRSLGESTGLGSGATNAPPPPTGRGSSPALGRDESVFGGRQTRPAQQPQRRPRSGGGLGGMMRGGMGRMALSILASVLMGGGLGRPRTSRRTQRRTGGDLGSILGGGRSSRSGGLGGVLRKR